MGTLHNQPERDYMYVSLEQLSGYLEDIVRLAKEHSMRPVEVLAAAQLLELKRRNDLFVRNGDIWDEQISGIGTALDRIAESMPDLG